VFGFFYLSRSKLAGWYRHITQPDNPIHRTHRLRAVADDYQSDPRFAQAIRDGSFLRQIELIERLVQEQDLRPAVQGAG
jgi:hypothetical protein